MSGNICLTKCAALCCKYMAMEIDTPTAAADFENIYWFLAHKNVDVYISEKSWYVLFDTECSFLENGKCRNYENRPALCKNYCSTACEMTKPPDYDFYFSTAEDLLKYINKKHPDKFSKLKIKLGRLK